MTCARLDMCAVCRAVHALLQSSAAYMTGQSDLLRSAVTNRVSNYQAAAEAASQLSQDILKQYTDAVGSQAAAMRAQVQQIIDTVTGVRHWPLLLSTAIARWLLLLTLITQCCCLLVAAAHSSYSMLLLAGC